FSQRASATERLLRSAYSSSRQSSTRSSVSVSVCSTNLCASNAISVATKRLPGPSQRCSTKSKIGGGYWSAGALGDDVCLHAGLHRTGGIAARALSVPRKEVNVRFHAAQAVALHIAFLIIQTLFGVISTVSGSSVGGSLFKLAAFTFLLISMLRVWRGEPHRISPLQEP